MADCPYLYYTGSHYTCLKFNDETSLVPSARLDYYCHRSDRCGNCQYCGGDDTLILEHLYPGSTGTPSGKKETSPEPAGPYPPVGCCCSICDCDSLDLGCGGGFIKFIGAVGVIIIIIVLVVTWLANIGFFKSKVDFTLVSERENVKYSDYEVVFAAIGKKDKIQSYTFKFKKNNSVKKVKKGTYYTMIVKKGAYGLLLPVSQKIDGLSKFHPSVNVDGFNIKFIRLSFTDKDGNAIPVDRISCECNAEEYRFGQSSDPNVGYLYIENVTADKLVLNVSCEGYNDFSAEFGSADITSNEIRIVLEK